MCVVGNQRVAMVTQYAAAAMTREPARCAASPASEQDPADAALDMLVNGLLIATL